VQAIGAAQSMQGELQAAVRSAVGPETAMARSCFAAAPGGPVAARLGAAAVSLTGIDFQGGAVTAGSGVIVADSASPENPFNKILTVSIVSRSRGAALTVEVIDSTGALVGWAEEIAAGAEADAKGALAAALLPRVVVLAVAVFVPGQETRYAALPGAPLASAPLRGRDLGRRRCAGGPRSPGKPQVRTPRRRGSATPAPRENMSEPLSSPSILTPRRPTFSSGPTPLPACFRAGPGRGRPASAIRTSSPR
jgi:hypothetical protein